MDNVVINPAYASEIQRKEKPAIIQVHVKIAIFQNSLHSPQDAKTPIRLFEKTFPISQRPNQGMRFTLPVGRTVAPEEGIRLEHTSVSRTQGYIILFIESGAKEPYFYYEDTSTFGSLLNGFRFCKDTKPLRNNDRIGIGLYPDEITPVYTLEFHYSIF